MNLWQGRRERACGRGREPVVDVGTEEACRGTYIIERVDDFVPSAGEEESQSCQIWQQLVISPQQVQHPHTHYYVVVFLFTTPLLYIQGPSCT